MLDIETTGRTPGCAVIQIAAVLFNANTGDISNKYRFKESINFNTQLKNGYTYSKETVAWWNRTNKSLFNELCRSNNNYIDVGKNFQKWYRNLPNFKKLRLWGNSPKFDIAILEGWYRKSIGNTFDPFWDTWSERDLRTISALAPDIKKKKKFVGTQHDAIDDCLHQISYLYDILSKLNIKIH